MYPEEMMMSEMSSMVMEIDTMMMALLMVANLIGLVALSIFAVYAVGLGAMALSDKLGQLRRPPLQKPQKPQKPQKLPKLNTGQMNPNAVRTVLQ
ncbi:MAG: hypothetical protein ACKVZH_01085 [Blastocatellia bacterium]